MMLVRFKKESLYKQWIIFEKYSRVSERNVHFSLETHTKIDHFKRNSKSFCLCKLAIVTSSRCERLSSNQFTPKRKFTQARWGVARIWPEYKLLHHSDCYGIPKKKLHFSINSLLSNTWIRNQNFFVGIISIVTNRTWNLLKNLYLEDMD